MNKVLQVHDLSKVFPGSFLPWEKKNSVRALDKVSFSIEDPGEIISVSGPNGSGKTTLLKCISGILSPTRGSISMFGKDFRAHSHELKKYIGTSTDQERSFYWRLSGRDNIRFFAGLFGMKTEVLDGRIEDLADKLDVKCWLDKSFSQYSTGIRQRFSLMRALVHGPKLLLLDEPYRSLDAAAREELGELLKTLSTASATTIILTTHRSHVPGIEGVRRILLEKGQRVS